MNSSDKESMKKFFWGCAVFCLCAFAFGQGVVEAQSKVNWIAKEFSSTISLDMEKSHLSLPSGKSSAAGLIKIKTPSLLNDSILYLLVDNANYVGDLTESGIVTLEQITKIIENGKTTPEIISQDEKTISITNTINMLNINRQLIRHKFPYTQEIPFETVSTRAYSGIIIDARGSIPVHGEYVSDEVYPCFYPQVWSEDMSVVYEKNMVEYDVAAEKGIVSYHFTDDFSALRERVGIDPLYLRAFKVYGRNRTDPILRKKDALKIISNEKNLELLRKGKVVILLDEKNLVLDAKIPEKSDEYYASLRSVKKYIYENKIPDINVSDSPSGILFSVDLKFVPDSSTLIPSEGERIKRIAEMLKEIIANNEFTILVEGHTADLGKPIGQMNLSIERTRNVMNALINEGVPEELFSYKGYGATQPIASNDTEEGRAQNRRVDITARPRATYIRRQ